jgi:hypothetical protein
MISGALRGFFRIAEAWRLDRGQMAAIFVTSLEEIDSWRAHPQVAELTPGEVERLSYVIGIYAGLHAIFGEFPFADDWIRQPNADFMGCAPLDRMLAGNLADLVTVSRYVEMWRFGIEAGED